MRKLLLGFALCAFAGTAARADDAADLVKKAMEAHGGEKALRAAKAGEISSEGEMAIAGAELKFTATASYMLPGKFAMAIETELMGMKLSILNVVSGDKVKLSLKKETQKLTPEQKSEILQSGNSQELILLYPLLEDKKYTLKLEPDAKVGDAECAVLLVQIKGAKDWKLYVDKKSGLLLKMSHKAVSPIGGGIVDEESFLGDYKKVDGIQVAMSLKVLHDGKHFMKAKITDAKFSEKLDDKKFAVDD